MLNNIVQFFKRFRRSEKEESKSTAKERLHLVLAQDRANISADFLEMMKQEILEVIKKYIDIDEKAIDVRLTNKEGEDGSVGAPALYANIPIITIKNNARKLEGTLKKEQKEDKKEENNKEANRSDEKKVIEKIEEQEKVIEEKNVDENSIKEKADNNTDNGENNQSNDEFAQNQQKKSENDNLDEVDNEKKNS